jgi:hypothetical protein
MTKTETMLTISLSYSARITLLRRGSSVRTVIRAIQPENWDSVPHRDRDFVSLLHSDQLWSPLNLIFNSFFPEGKASMVQSCPLNSL